MDFYEKFIGMKIFFDLDGTLIDSRDRLYRLFQHLVPSSNLTFEDYWNYKRNKIDHKKILGTRYFFSEKDILSFQKNWLDIIELPEWLAFDKPFEGVTNFLKELKPEHELYLVTARQSKINVAMQLADFGWTNIFTKSFVTQQKAEKISLIENVIATSANDWFIGDTGKDIETGKSLGIKTAAVLSGFLNKEKLMEYEPDLIIDTVIDFRTVK